uniref:Isomerase n=1 Tax=Aegilops tauschii subsp. strangulata TaxID=200361 RepID=A0A453EP70_AEGTS
VQPVPDRLPLPRLLLPRSRRRHPAVPPPLVHHRHRGRALRARTLATAHFLFTAILGERHGVVEFATKSGILTAKKVPAPETEEQGKLFIELNFPMSDYVGCDPADELPSIPETLNGASVVSVHKSLTTTDFIVELSSGKEVADVLPNIEEIRKCAGRGVIVTAPAPAGSGYDFFTRFFCPKFGIDEDPVCGSAHCVLAPYWGGKLGKQKLIAFQVSPRSGALYLELDVANQRVRIQGEAVTVMAGTLFA